MPVLSLFLICGPSLTNKIWYWNCLIQNLNCFPNVSSACATWNMPLHLLSILVGAPDWLALGSRICKGLCFCFSCTFVVQWVHLYLHVKANLFGFLFTGFCNEMFYHFVQYFQVDLLNVSSHVLTKLTHGMVLPRNLMHGFLPYIICPTWA